MNIANQMIHEYSCQCTCDSWVLVVFTFILDLAAVNTRAILKYNKENYSDSRWDLLRKLATSLTILFIKNRAQLSLNLVTLLAINNVSQSCGKSETTDIEEHEPVEVMSDGKCHICLKNLHGLEDKERHQRKANFNKIKGKCKHCKKSICPGHWSKKVEDSFHSDICASWVLTAFGEWSHRIHPYLISNHQKFYDFRGYRMGASTK